MSDKIQLYSLATPNGQKVSVALEEMNIPYDAHRINILEGDQFTDEFIKINPNSKIPAIVDPTANNGKGLPVMESGSILMYLAEKSGQFLPKDPILKSQTLQWLFFQVGSVGPMFGQFGHFYKYAKEKHDYSIERYKTETIRLLNVIEKQLGRNKFIACDEYTIADMAIFPWVDCLGRFYQAGDILGLEDFTKINAWLDGIMQRPAVQKGIKVCGFD